MSFSSSNHACQPPSACAMRKMPARVLRQKNCAMQITLPDAVIAEAYLAAHCSNCETCYVSRHITPLDDALTAGELATLVGLPIHNNGDIADLCLTSDDWAALTERRRRVGWPLNFLEVADVA